MIRPQTPPISLHLFAVPLIRFLSNGGSHCVVSQCHLATHCKHLSPPYLYFMLLPFRPWAACCKASGRSFSAGAHFRQREDQVVITALRSRVLAAGVLYSDIPKGSNCVALSKMTPDLYFYQDDLFTQTGSCDHAVVFFFFFRVKEKYCYA